MSEPYTGHNPIRYLLSEGKQFLSKHRDIVYPNSWETRREVKLWNTIGVQTGFIVGAWIYVYQEMLDNMYDVYRMMIISTYMGEEGVGMARENFHKACISSIRFTKPMPDIVNAKTGEPIFEYVAHVDFKTLQEKFL